MFAINIENSKKIKYCIFSKKHKIFLLVTVSVVMSMKKIFKEEESIEIFEILGLINDIEEYQKIYNHA